MLRKYALLCFLITALLMGMGKLSNSQSLPVLIDENEQLILQAKSLLNEIAKAKTNQDFMISYFQQLDEQITIVQKQAVKRRMVLADLQKEAKSSLIRPSKRKLREREESLFIHRYERENEKAYCDAVHDVLQATPLFSSNKKVYFARGRYLIPFEYKTKAFEVYGPLFDSIARIANAHPKRHFDVYFKIDGYSDNNTARPGSELYNDMVQRMRTTNLNADEINTYISYLRAYDIAHMLKELSQEKRKLITDKERVSFNFQPKGFGAKIPEHLLNEQEPTDDKRRVVLLYWHILPKF